MAELRLSYIPSIAVSVMSLSTINLFYFIDELAVSCVTDAELCKAA